MKTKITPVLLLSFFLITTPRCTLEQFCENKALCDLFSNTVLPVTGVLLGVDLTVVSLVYNAATANVDCTEDAGASKSGFDVEYRVNSSSPWETISNVVLQVGSLIADSDPDQKEVTMNFNEPGDYRFKTDADNPEEIEERDEENNGSCAGCRPAAGSNNNVSYSEILTVYENPEIPYDPSKPQVVIVSIK